MKKHLNESPDEIITDSGEWKFDDVDASTFVYYPQRDLLFRASTGKWNNHNRMFHSNMFNLFASIGRIFLNDYISDSEDGSDEKVKTVEQFNRYCEILDLGIFWDDSGGLIRSVGSRKEKPITLQCFGDTGDTISFFELVAKSPHAETGFDDSTFRTDRSIGICGRYWDDTEVSSFWMSLDELAKFIAAGTMDLYFDYMNISKENARLNTVEYKVGVLSTSDVLSSAGKSPALTKAQQADLMAQKHLKKTTSDRDSWQMKRHDPDEMEAVYNHRARQSDGILKLGSLIKEDPDAVDADDGTELLTFRQGGWGFICFPCSSILGSGAYHRNIWDKLLDCYSARSLEPMDDDDTYEISDPKALLKDLLDKGGFLNTIVTSIPYKFNYRGDPRIVAGRCWPKAHIRNKKSPGPVISFWGQQTDVLHNWKFVEDMFHKFSGDLGPLRGYYIDWIERRHRGGSMTSASSITGDGKITPTGKPFDWVDGWNDGKTTSVSKPAVAANGKFQADPSIHQPVDSNGQLNFIAKLFKRPDVIEKLTPEQLKAVQEKLHVLDPEEKKKAMDVLGMNTPHKAAMIANKLGMSVAEFNHLMNVNESSIQLKSLMPSVCRS